MSRTRALARTSTAVLVLPGLVLGLGACGLVGGDGDGGGGDGDRAERAEEPASSTSASGPAGSGEVVLVTHESFALPDDVVEAWEQETGYELVVRPGGDAGELSAKLALTAGNPTGDVAFGIDNTFASRVLDEGVFAVNEPTLPPGAEDLVLPEGADRLAPIDQGNVCVNIDTTWFEREGLAPPETLEDLTDPAYRDLFVTPAASTSSPGMAFLLATIAAFGEDGWQQYWTDLLDNGTLLVDGWSDAYYTDFTQGGEGGERPIVLSYDSSPAFTVKGGRSTTTALLDTCFRQVEYAGVLEGAENPEGAAAVVDLLLSDEVQAALPESMYVYPVNDDVELPADWARFAEQPTDPFVVDPTEIAAQRETWLSEWTDVTSR